MVRLLLVAPLLVLLVTFALSNSHDVRIALWPVSGGVDVPVSIAILVAMAVGMLLGAIMLWLPALSLRRRARRAEQAAELLESQIRQLKARGVAPALPAPE